MVKSSRAKEHETRQPGPKSDRALKLEILYRGVPETIMLKTERSSQLGALSGLSMRIPSIVLVRCAAKKETRKDMLFNSKHMSNLRRKTNYDGKLIFPIFP